jgi:hypothetical protein
MEPFAGHSPAGRRSGHAESTTDNPDLSIV